MPHITANGIEIYYEIHGPDDGDVLVLSNGILMSTASWPLQVGVLSQKYRLLLYDCRGMWQSEHPAGPYSMDLHADDLAALLDRLAIDRAHIGGISYGGEVSMAFALRYPARTRSLIISSAVSQVDTLLAGWMASWLSAARAADPELLFEVTFPLNFSEGWLANNQTLLAAARERYTSLDFVALEVLLTCFGQVNLTPRLHQIDAPTLVMVGEQDILKPRKYAEIIAREIPHSTLAVLPGAGHAACWEQPTLFNSLILGFLALQECR